MSDAEARSLETVWTSGYATETAAALVLSRTALIFGMRRSEYIQDTPANYPETPVLLNNEHARNFHRPYRKIRVFCGRDFRQSR